MTSRRPTPQISISVRVSEHLYDLVREAAVEADLSIAGVITQILSDHFAGKLGSGETRR